MKLYTIILAIILMTGCTPQTETEIGTTIPVEQVVSQTEDNETGHIKLCSDEPQSIFCTNSESIGDIQPTREYVMNILEEHEKNFEYVSDGEVDHWKYNESIYQHLSGDCEDKALTMVKHMVEEGIDKKYLSLVYIKTSETTAHLFLAVETSDAWILHLDYADSGYPIELQIDLHMRMDDVGTDKWIRGNIK